MIHTHHLQTLLVFEHRRFVSWVIQINVVKVSFPPCGVLGVSVQEFGVCVVSDYDLIMAFGSSPDEAGAPAFCLDVESIIVVAALGGAVANRFD